MKSSGYCWLPSHNTKYHISLLCPWTSMLVLWPQSTVSRTPTAKHLVAFSKSKMCVGRGGVGWGGNITFFSRWEYFSWTLHSLLNSTNSLFLTGSGLLNSLCQAREQLRVSSQEPQSWSLGNWITPEEAALCMPGKTQPRIWARQSWDRSKSASCIFSFCSPQHGAGHRAVAG